MSEILLITQEQLQAYLVSQARAAEARSIVGTLRRALIVQLKAGADVEVGSLIARTHIHQVRRLTWGKLISLLGDDEAMELKSAITPTVSTSLIVEPRKKGADFHVSVALDNE